MKASDLIAHLQHVVAQEGDIDLAIPRLTGAQTTDSYEYAYARAILRHRTWSASLLAPQPCPFCGEKVEFEYNDNDEGLGYIECPRCHVMVTGTKDETIARWNTRTTIPYSGR